MPKRTLLAWSAASVASLLAGSVLAASEVLTIHNDDYSSTIDYWSGINLDEVPPMPFYDEENDPFAIPSYFQEEQEPLGPSGRTESGLPERERETYRGTKGAAESEEDSVVDGAQADFALEDGINFGTIDEFDSFQGSREKWNKTAFPWSAIGKLYFSVSGGTASCSASVIGENDAIVTAAHCCYEPGVGFYSNWLFVPGKHGSIQPFGSWEFTDVSVLSAWAEGGGRRNDVCVLSMETGLSAATGWLGRSWGKPQTEHVFTIGYPGNKGGGERQYYCVSENYPNCGDFSVNATGCDKTYGDSGAPWIRVYRPRTTGRGNYVNSVTSGYDECTGTFGKSYNGARFRNGNIVTLCNIRACD